MLRPAGLELMARRRRCRPFDPPHGHDVLARIIHRTLRVPSICAGGRRFGAAAGFDTALRAVLKTSPGLVLSEGPRIRA